MSYGNDQYGQSANYGGGNDPYGQGGNDPYGQNQGGGYDQQPGGGYDQQSGGGYDQSGGGYPEPSGMVGQGYGAGAYGAPGRPSIKFNQALPLAVKNYANFYGRASRSEFWYFVLTMMLINIVFSILLNLFGGLDPTTAQPNTAAGMVVYVISGLVSLALLVPYLAVGARRRHDTNRSGWWLLLGLGAILIIPAIILIVFLAGQSKPEGARFDNPNGSQPTLP